LGVSDAVRGSASESGVSSGFQLRLECDGVDRSEVLIYVPASGEVALTTAAVVTCAGPCCGPTRLVVVETVDAGHVTEVVGTITPKHVRGVTIVPACILRVDAHGPRWAAITLIVLEMGRD
jgi:hypothetical protein